MKFKTIEKSKLPTFLRELAKEYKIFMPVKEKNIVTFERISFEDDEKIERGMRMFQLRPSAVWNTKKPPKEVLFPQTETLFMYRTGKEHVELRELPGVKHKRVLMGVRPCDAKSFVLLNKFFSSGDHTDEYYSDKMKNTIIVGLACKNPRGTCFCTSVGGNPSGREGMDMLLWNIDGKYLIETVTERGERLIENFPWLKDAEKRDIEYAKRLSEDAEKAIRSKVSVVGVSDKLDEIFDDVIWDKISEKCIGCGVCTYLCPTCCCFDVLDEEKEEWKRVRIWDSCQFSCFTLQGSGHNPRPSGKERMRQRIMHKFNYSVKNFGETFCVGCGRCVEECPVNLDIREIVESISTRQAE